MTNKYANIDGAIKIKDNYNLINLGFDGVQADMQAIQSKVNNHVGGSADNHSSTAVTNGSSVAGTTVSNALDTLKSLIDNLNATFSTDVERINAINQALTDAFAADDTLEQSLLSAIATVQAEVTAHKNTDLTVHPSDKVSFEPTGSDLVSTNVDAAVKELNTKVNDNKTNTDADLLNHKNSLEAHDSSAIINQSSVLGSKVTDALNALKTSLDDLASSSSNDFEVIDARTSDTKSITYATLDGRLEASELDILNQAGEIQTLQGDMSTAHTDLSAIQADLSASSEQTASLPHGLSVITTDQATPLVPNIKGRTLVNLLGKDGNCEDTTKWLVSGVSLSLDAANIAFGSNSIKITLSGTSGNMYKANLFDPTKYYFVRASLKNGNSVGISMDKDSTGGGAWITSTIIADTTKFIHTGFKLQPSDIGSGDRLRIRLTDASTEYAYADGVAVYEIPASDYNLTIDELLAKYPYVDSVQHVQNPYIIKQGKNLLPPFTEWTLHADHTVVEPYGLEINTATLNTSSTITIPVIAGQTYTLNATFSSTVGRFRVARIDSTFIAEIRSSNPSVTFTVPAGCEVVVIASNNNIETGICVISNPQLELGSVVTAFEPANPDYLFAEVKLASNNDQSVQDELFFRDGQLRKLKRFEKDVVLDGLLTWIFNSDHIGFKMLFCTSIKNYLPSTSNMTGVKYDGKILNFWTDPVKADNIYMDNVPGTGFYVTVADIDSGWGDSYTPTSDEIKAYFYGWKMYESGVATSGTYNGTGTKAWYPVTRAKDSFNASYYTTVLPTTLCPYNIAWEPYSLTYQLADSVEEPVTVEGSLMLHEGANQIEVGEGVIVREVGTVELGVSNNYINNNGQEYSWLDYRSNKIFNVYEDGSPYDFGVDTAGYGGARVIIYKTNYDPNAQYTVTYLVLDKYLFTGANLNTTAKYQTNLKTVVDEVVKDLTNLGGEHSILANLFADQKIVEFGSNANGEYVRWANGLQVCWKNVSCVYFSADLLRGDWVHPSGFVELPSVSAMRISNGTCAVTDRDIGQTRGSSSTTLSYIYVYRISGATTSFVSGNNLLASVIAIGRWK